MAKMSLSMNSFLEKNKNKIFIVLLFTISLILIIVFKAFHQNQNNKNLIKSKTNVELNINQVKTELYEEYKKLIPLCCRDANMDWERVWLSPLHNRMTFIHTLIWHSL